MDPNYTSQLLASVAAWSLIGFWARQWLANRDATRDQGGQKRAGNHVR